MRITSSVQTRKKHKRILKRAKGFVGARRNRYRCAKEAVNKALEHSTIDRRKRRRDLKQLWIKRISNLLSMHGFSYSRSIGIIRKTGLNNNTAARLAVFEPDALIQIVRDANEK